LTVRLVFAVAVTLISAPGLAQTMDHSAMPGTVMPGRAMPVPPADAQPAPDAGQAMPAADRIWGREAMAASRAALRREHGGGTFSQVMIDLAEYQVRDSRDAFRWDGAGWFGGDVDRLVVKSEGAGAIGDGVDDAEVQALYSRAIGPYFNVQAGVRYDIAPGPARGYAVLGVEGLAPYWFDVEGALFVSAKGDLLARLEGYYDQRITQRLILQPRAEIDLAAQDVPASGIGAGVSQVDLGLRLRYEIVREFAPYVGVTYERKLGATARLARGGGDDVGGSRLVIGVRAWF
jgi:copper resistance protein B